MFFYDLLFFLFMSMFCYVFSILFYLFLCLAMLVLFFSMFGSVGANVLLCFASHVLL